MKPVRLSFSGLNSYRSRQEIDFETLGADGLFGIFGPTGSGKSSILDAITLALYGGVDRASNNTRGIIHQLEKSLEVAFQFQLGEERFLVERRYDRNSKDPEAAMAKKARLRKFSSCGETVLASKPQEVTARIEGILGIGKDEFSRAVVLPQGKFDRFLRLTGGERAAMLEHLFNLEQYGEELVAKVKHEVVSITEQLQRIEGEIQGLGDCSEEAVNQEVLDLKGKNQSYLAAQQIFETVDQSFKEMESVGELFSKRQSVQKKLDQLQQEWEMMEIKQSRLNAAERAEPLRELLIRQKELNCRINEESIIYQKKMDFHSIALIKHNRAAKEWEKATRDFQEQLPQLQERKALYQGAKEKQIKIEDIKAQLGLNQRELKDLRAKIVAAAKEGEQCKELNNATRIALEALQQERSKLIVNQAEKEAIELALSILTALEESERRRQESIENYTSRKLKNDSRWSALIRIVQEMSPGQTVKVSDDLEQYSQSLLSQIEKELDEARQARHQALIINSAAELVKELHDGEPCPVCGSREHPSPAKTTDDLKKVDEIITITEQRLRQARDWEGRLLKTWRDWIANEALVSEGRELAEKRDQELRNALAEFDKVRGAYDREQLRNRKQELIKAEKELQIIEGKREKLLKTQDELSRKLQKLNDALQNDKIKEASLQEVGNSLQRQLEDFTDELDRITGGRDLEVLIRELVQSYEKLQSTVENTKDIAEETRNTLEKSAREIAAVEATLAANREELAGVERRLAEALEKAGFPNLPAVEAVLLETSDRQRIRQELEQYRQEVAVSHSELEQLDREINNRPFDEASYEELKTERERLFQEVEQLKTETVLAKKRVEELQEKQERWSELQKQKVRAEKRKGLAEELLGLLRGRRFVSFLAQEHLREMTLEASYQLGRLTGQRYALELAKDKDCEFVIRDDYNGGNRRAINSLSGGEIFMTSLALALALSSKIQLRGKYPLGFFFLDEGFGSLDEEKLDKVMTALEKLHDKNRIVGVISHVREMKERIPRYLEVVPAGEDGSGSKIKG